MTAPRGYGATEAMSQALALSREPATWLVCPSGAAESDEWANLAGAVRATDGGWVVLTDIDSAEVAVNRLPAVADWLPGNARLALLAHTNLAHLALLDHRSVQVDRDDLAFTPEEATSLLFALTGDSDPEELGELVEMCQGWASALVLAGGRLRRGGRRATTKWLAGSGAQSIVGSWLAGLDERASGFLKASAILDDLQPDLCDAVLGTSESAEILLDLERDEGLLTRASDDGIPAPVWHRHPLLTLALRARHSKGDGTREAHRRAASWYRTHDRVDSVMHHYVSAGLNAEAGDYLSEHERALLSGGSASRALDWYEQLTEDAWGERANRELRLAWGRLLSGDSQGARDALAGLTDLLAQATVSQGDSSVLAELTGERFFLAAYLSARAADPAQVISQAQQAWELFGNTGGQDSHVMAPTLVARGLVWSDRLVSARRVLDGVDPLRFPSGNIREVSLAGVRALCEVGEGRIVAATASLTAGRRWLRYVEADPLETGHFTFANAEAALAIEIGDPIGADRLASQVETAALAHGDLGEATMARVIRARAAYNAGEVATALATVSSARAELMRETPTSDMRRLLDILEVNCHIVAGDSAKAESLLTRWPLSDSRTLVAARLTVARKPAQTVRALSAVNPQTVRGIVTKQLLLAIAQMQLNRRLAGAHLVEAAILAVDNGLTLVLPECPEVQDLVEELAAEFGREQFKGLELRQDDPDPGSLLPAEPMATSRLSAGELELLALMPERMTNAQLAAKLGISVNTLKTRLQRLYRKLGVNRSYDAVAVGRRRGLIAASDER